MIVGGNFLFIHIPKTSGSSIAKYLVDRGYGKKHSGASFPEHGALADPNFRMPNHISEKTIFSIVRNPYEREFSQWKYHTEKGDLVIKPTFEEWVLWRYSDFKMPIDWFIKERQEWTYNRLKKFSTQPMIGYLLDKHGKCRVQRIGNFENREEDTSKIFSELKIEYVPYHYPHIEKCTLPIKSKDYKKYFTKETKELIEERYKPDLDVFGYSFHKRESAHPNKLNLDKLKNPKLIIENIGGRGYNYKVS